MTMNQQSFDYIKSNFPTAQHITDYNDDIEYWLNQTISNPAEPLFIQNLRKILVNQLKGNFGVWKDKNLPTGKEILRPDSADSYWVAKRVEIIKTAISSSNSAQVTNEQVIKYLKKFDDNVPSNVSLDDKALEGAWDKWFKAGAYGMLPGGAQGCFEVTATMKMFAYAVSDRLKDYTANSSPTTPPGAPADVPEPPPVAEPDLSLERAAALEEFLSKVYYHDTALTYNSNNFYQVVRGRNSLSFNDNLDDPMYMSFKNVIAPTGEITQLNEKYQKNLFEKIEASGLYDLLAHADAIQSYGQARLLNVNRVSMSGAAANVLDGARDTAWLQQLGIVLTRLSREPIVLATIYQYFPDLVNYFFTALAITGDYSNAGAGGSANDKLNREAALLNDLMSSFGQKNGVNIFRGAWDKSALITTGESIANAIKTFPFRQNIPPASPDIFHLRLGASNFYIPPLSINVSNAFKASSLGGGALRQKNSPKYNTGHKHTTITMQLYFPNYEEIWGISIEDASKISLKDNFTLDFSADGDNEEKIDKFLSSLRGLVAAFKYAPFLPIRNHYINSVYGVTGVSLHAMNISTLPNYPFALVVELELYAFNHKPYLPMISDFNQAINWGKFRQYMGKAAGALHNYINEEFLVATDLNPANGKTVVNTDRSGTSNYNFLTDGVAVSPANVASEQLLGYKNEEYTTNVVSEWVNGSNISFYMPAETQTKIFTPDVSGFRSQEENYIAATDQSRGLWNSMLSTFGIDVSSAGYGLTLDGVLQTSVGNIVDFTVRQKILDSIDILTAGRSSKDFQKQAYAFLARSFVLQNPILNTDEKNFIYDMDTNTNAYTSTVYDYRYGTITHSGWSLYDWKLLLKKTAEKTETYLDFLVNESIESDALNNGKQDDQGWKDNRKDYWKKQYAAAFSATVYERFFKSGPIRDLLEAARERAGSFHFREWEVPMVRVDLDPTKAIVTGVSVSMSNNIVPLQLQMQEEPTYQHVGGGDTRINISMTIIGESELIKLRKIFEHINGLARLEHATGVLGFLGIKNIITALAGVKYVLPLNFNITTKENYPHVYDVQLRLIDFDIFQQKRESLSSEAQKNLIENFGTKKNPFLRIKQLWGATNAYPDFPLDVRDSSGGIVGCLDPDFYFRSFQMLDNDVVNNIKSNNGKLDRLNIEKIDLGGKIVFGAGTGHGSMVYQNTAIIEKFKDYIKNNDIKGLKAYSSGTLGLDAAKTASYLEAALMGDTTDKFLLSYVDSLDEKEFNNSDLSGLNYNISSGKFQVGSVSSVDAQAKAKLTAALSGTNKDDLFNADNLVSFDPDDLDAHAVIHSFSAVSNGLDNKIPSMIQTADGYQFGYIDKTNGRFYLTIDDVAVKKDGSVSYIGYSDTQTPDNGTTKSLTGIPGAKALSEYQYAFSSGDSSKPETMGDPGHSKAVSNHWEKMMLDTSYRDLSGRMVRAFPTYMLWLISEGNFAGTKLFDNFYGLQSVSEFSIVSSEDILGDTLILKISNMYAKLSTKEITTLFSGPGETNAAAGTNVFSLAEGVENIIDQTLNNARNILGHMESQYVVNIENIRLKPGVRIHLRGGYGSNPNSLHTLFNGVITEVELGEEVTVTCQSDAIELSPVVNSTDKKGDSGHIDGGLNTGLYLSEPRDLMVRLLSMGTSRTREAFAQSTRGMVFSENKFGIKHFGTILYEPLNEIELNRSSLLRNTISDAMLNVGQGSGIPGLSTVAQVAGIAAVGGAIGATGGLLGLPIGAIGGTVAGGAIGIETRTGVLGMMRTMWANFSSSRDLELFKRNIYPGNGTGVAQFLGGDLGDGWANAATLTPEDIPNTRLDYLNRLTDASWNDVLRKYNVGSAPASATLDTLTAGMGVKQSGGGTSAILGGLTLGIGAALAYGTGGLALPVIGGTLAAGGGASLLGSISGRGGVNIWKTFGLVSDLDDDMPGFDEVSFRAQTYMKSVWDLFQTCARLLPNYIVAVRPFEDRSTIFYGKPHWLYTSGVVPITTGFPSEKRAIELGITTPRPINPDSQVMDIMNKIQQTSNSKADYDAFRNARNPLTTLSTIVNDQLNASNVYAPAGILKGKVIRLTDPNRLIYQDSKKKNVAKIPKNKGLVGVGFHLPIDPDGKKTEIDISEPHSEHFEIEQMPLRYAFPYFTDRLTSAPLKDYAFFASGDEALGHGYSHTGLQKDTLYVNLLITEASLLKGTTPLTEKIQDSSGDSDEEFSITLTAPVFKASIDPIAVFGSDNFVFNIATAGSLSSNKAIIRMPLPLMKNEQTVSDGSWEYDYINESKITTSNKFSYRDWGSPSTALDEQFYIAMKWPYKITEDLNDEMFKKFKQEYFSGYEDKDFCGTVDDYKKRKVLVYSPVTKTAVVCKPAYFLWGKGETTNDEFTYGTTAIVSPDAAYFLGLMHLTETEKRNWLNDPQGGNKSTDLSYKNNAPGGGAYITAATAAINAGLAPMPIPRECYFTFVDDSIPLGVVTTLQTPTTEFKTNYGGGTDSTTENDRIIGFGKFQNSTTPGKMEVELASLTKYSDHMSPDALERSQAISGTALDAFNTQWLEFVPTGGITLLDSSFYASAAAMGGNILATSGSQDGYFDMVINAEKNGYNGLDRKALWDILDTELATTGKKESADGRARFAPVYDPSSKESVDARAFFDEGFSNSTHVIAGNGRTLAQANDVWDQFRFGYHTYDAVKKIFFDAFGLDPENVDAMPKAIIDILRDPTKDITIFKPFSSTNKTAEDEFAMLLGSDFINTNNQGLKGPVPAPTIIEGVKKTITTDIHDVKAAIEYARKNLVDAPLDQGGLIKYFDVLAKSKYKKLGLFLQSQTNINIIFGSDISGGARKVDDIITENFSAKQVFLLIVGMFRQAMWQDPYARAWLVLKPNRKYSSDDMWDFSPVNKIFAAFIDPNQNYSSDKKKFLKLLAENKGEGNSAGNVLGVLTHNTGEFWSNNIGPIFTAISDGLSGLLSMFRMSMVQTGYGLSELDNFTKQANILNRALNDSIYYSLGRAGSLLRATDNPFTREYGEPVVEIREPFQKMHYINSFSHILTNQIQESTIDVATQITAVSDGKYPVTVALDKSIPSERQIEKTVETGIYFDNVAGDGLFGIAQPLFHPIEFARGAIKLSQGAPDELMAKRVGLAHLKESLKDIYSGEIVVIGSPDIRPHDLVYLADVYERMYGIFEVEQVVHHFTSDLGFITSITPNAFVTVNDPARWFMSSWVHSYFSLQNMRNDTKMIINSVQAGNTGILSGGNISVDGIHQALSAQMLGGLQFTHGSSSLMSDIMANFAAEGLSDAQSQIDKQIKANNSAPSLTGIASAYLIAGGLGAAATALLAPTGFGLAAGALGAGIGGDLMWKGWKWVRDNVLDQHGCYIGYLNKNGQPMDAGLAINQGMTVGRYATKRLLPGILGVKTRTKTPEGNAYIRYDDLLKNMGWQEKQIGDLIRYTSYENALVNAEVLKYSGTGPDKTGLNQFFKVLCKLNRILNADEIEVIDLLDPSGTPFIVRLDGIIASSLNVFKAYAEGKAQSAINTTAAGSRAAVFVEERLIGKPFVIRVSPNDQSSVSIYAEDQMSPGSSINTPKNYKKATTYNKKDDTLGTVFYKILDQDLNSVIQKVRGLFLTTSGFSVIGSKSIEQIKAEFKNTLYPDSNLFIKFDTVFDSLSLIDTYNNSYFTLSGSNDPLANLTADYKFLFNILVNFRIIDILNTKASEWPYVSWDEYYEDGSPATLNWELVVNNLAQVYTVDLLRERPSVISLDDQLPMPTLQQQNPTSPL